MEISHLEFLKRLDLNFRYSAICRGSKQMDKKKRERQRERQRERDRDRKRETETETERQRDSERERERQRDTETDREEYLPLLSSHTHSFTLSLFSEVWNDRRK